MGTYRGYGPELGLRGHWVGLDGSIYLIRSNNAGYGGVGNNDGTAGRVDVYAADGTLKAGAIINGLGHGDCGLGVDAVGNIYVGMNIKTAAQPLPAYFAGKVPAKRWVWWPRGKPAGPWYWPYYNPYLYHLGAVVKFSARGGEVYGHGGRPRAKRGAPEPKVSPLISVKNAPANAVTFRAGYLAREIKIVGAQWHFLGCGPIPTSDVGWGDPSCVCMTSHLAVDPFGRVFAPNVFRFCVEVLDTAGNHLMRIGRYGNADSPSAAGPGSGAGGPEIPFAWPAFVSVADGKVYVSDSVNRRVVVVGLHWADERICSID